MKKQQYTCCICHKKFNDYGNNPAPVKLSGKCCNKCNQKFVLPARVEEQITSIVNKWKFYQLEEHLLCTPTYRNLENEHF